MSRLIVLAIVVAFPLIACGQGKAEEILRGSAEQVLAQTAAALEREDADFLGSVYSEDWTFVNASGSVLTKAQRITGLRSGELKYDSVVVTDPKLREYGDTAISTSRQTMKGQNAGQDFSGQYRVTTVLVKKKGKWSIVAQQSTRIN